jgi:hypothetical protein
LTGQVVAVVALFKVKELHVIVNSRLSQLLEVSKSDAFGRGRVEGVTAQQDRNDMLTALAVIESDKSSHSTTQPAQTKPSNTVKEQVVHVQTVEAQAVGTQTVTPTVVPIDAARPPLNYTPPPTFGAK